MNRQRETTPDCLLAARHPFAALGWLLGFGCLAGLLLAMTSLSVQATNIGTSPHISLAGNYNYATTGGTLRANDNLTNPCSLLSGLSGTSVDAGTSSATVSGIPAGSTIVGAYLYFVGDGDTPDYTVNFNGSTVTASQQYSDTLVFPGGGGGNANYNYFGGYVDVTSLVTGNGTYTFGGLSVQNVDNGGFGGALYCTNWGVVAGWGLVVVYQNGSEPLRVINIYDGLEHFYNSNITLNPGNFKIPTSPINGKFSVIVWGGDPDISGGETLSFNGTALTDVYNPAGNVYNSTIDDLGTLYTNQSWGVDIDTYDISAYLAAGQTSGTTYYATGNDDNYLTAEIVSVTNTPVADLAITLTNPGNFVAGSNGTYNIAIHNNGPDSATGTTTVTDTLPTGFTFVSGTGTGWTCSASGQNVTCTTTSTIATGTNANPITLTVAVSSSASNPSSDTATVAVDNAIFDNISGNNSSTDSATVLIPNLSTSTKDVVDVNGGDASPGDVLKYTITLQESGGTNATNVSVTDDIPAGVTGFTVVSTPSGSTNSSTGTGGANGTGYLNVTGITVPANGSVTIVYDVTVAATDAAGYTISNSATVNNPSGPGASPAAPTVTVLQSQVPASGNKILYVYDNLSMTRTPQTGTGAGAVSINSPGATQDWTLTPALQKPLTLIANSTVSVTLNVECTSVTGGGNCRNGTNLFFTATLYDKNGATLTQIGSTSPNASYNYSSYTLVTANVAVGATAVTVLAGDQLVMRITNVTTNSNRPMQTEQYNGGNLSTASLSVSTVINVDSVNVYNAAYPGTGTQSVYETNNTLYIRAVISDPFGSYDIDPATGGTAPALTITDTNGTVQLNAVSMTQVADSGAATKTFEYAYTLPQSPPASLALGYWTPSVTAWEGTEHTISHTANGSFDVEAPNLVVMKAVSAISDPAEGTTRPKAIPGATMQYLVNVSNQGKGTADSNTLAISDAIPANSSFVVGSVAFTDGSASSGLTFSSANISYSSDNGATWTYTPAAGANGTDPNVTNIRFSPQGSMNGMTGATAPSFNITFQVKIN